MFHQVNFYDLQFQRVPVEFKSMRGVLQIRLARVGMPRIPQNVINGVFYLYGTKKDALVGRDPGGTGFIVRYDGTFIDEVPGHHFYGVTNWHVACDGGFSVIRLNTKDGGTDVIELGPEEWSFLPGKYDVAAVQLSLDEQIHDISSISTSQFAAEPQGYVKDSIGVGDDVFMIGLFVDHNGMTTNVPSARFGNISMLPSTKAIIEQPTHYRGVSYIVDMHSRTGFSGSPVYVYRTFATDLTEISGSRFDGLEMNFDTLEIVESRPGASGSVSGRMRARSGRLQTRKLFQLLGIHWGQFPEKWELRDRKKLKEARKHLIVEGGYVEGMSGMTCVIPAWQILEVLNMPELKDLRHPGIVAAQKKNRLKAKPESISRSTNENPTHREDFTALLTEAARKREPKD